MVAMSAPPLPSLRALTAELRDLHMAWSHPDAGGEYACLVLVADQVDDNWQVMAVSQVESIDVRDADVGVRVVFGREYIPGDGAPFDAVGAARRLLAAARDR